MRHEFLLSHNLVDFKNVSFIYCSRWWRCWRCPNPFLNQVSCLYILPQLPRQGIGRSNIATFQVIILVLLYYTYPIMWQSATAATLMWQSATAAIATIWVKNYDLPVGLLLGWWREHQHHAKNYSPSPSFFHEDKKILILHQPRTWPTNYLPFSPAHSNDKPLVHIRILGSRTVLAVKQILLPTTTRNFNHNCTISE